MHRVLILISLMVCSPVIAQEGETDARVSQLSIDLNSDGSAESFELIENAEGTTDLTIVGNSARAVVALAFATTGEGSDLPQLSVLGDGRVAVTSFHDAQGPVRWTRSLWIGFPDGSYRVTGYSYVWWNPNDPTDLGFCELDFRAGHGVLHAGSGEPYLVDVDVPALPVAIWGLADKILPLDCE